MKFSDAAITAAREVLLKYTLSDALKPEYDGMTAFSLASKMLEAAQTVEDDKMVDAMYEHERSKPQDK